MQEEGPAAGEPILVFKDNAWRGANATHTVTLTEQAMQREAGFYRRRHPSQSAHQLPSILRSVAWWVENHDPTDNDVHVRPRREEEGDDDLPL